MADKWDAYIVDEKPADKWEAYVVKEPEKKTLWSKLGAEITPEMKAGYPVLSHIAQMGQDALTAPLHLINQLRQLYQIHQL